MSDTWVKQLTRENTLLDRSLRSIAYAQSVPEIGDARMANCPVVGKGRITTWYYSAEEYAKQQDIIVSEFQGVNADKMGSQLISGLESAYLWARHSTNSHSKAEFLNVLATFNTHHAHARGAIVYSYWGEPVITASLRSSLQDKVRQDELDVTISTLSAPRFVEGPLLEIYHPSIEQEEKKQALVATLALSPEEKKLVHILTWFTLLYELGERVSGLLYKKLLSSLEAVTTPDEVGRLEWYDPTSLRAYFLGNVLSEEEIARRKEFYVLMMDGNTLEVLSGAHAHDYYEKEFARFDVKAEQISEFSGTVACKGVIRGVVRIVVTREDQAKLAQGEILVSPMTTPSLMEAVKRAGAIVTDEGGMTAHAAIVSREFGIPCIVGTKIATQVLRDGDMVEVDADSGIIRKI